MKQRIPTLNNFILESKKDSELEYKSKLDKKFTVVIVYPGSPSYKEIQKLIPGDGLAVTDMRQKIMVMDGGRLDNEKLTTDHLYAIEAHEIAHHYLKHKGEFDIPEQEKEADYGAYLILFKHKMWKPAKITMDHFDARHGEAFEDFVERSGEQIKKKLKRYI